VRRTALITASLIFSLAGLGCKGRASQPEAQPTPAQPKPADDRTGPPDRANDEAPKPALVAVSEPGAGFADRLDRAAYEADLTFIASARLPGSAHWQAVQDRCVAAFEQAGFDVTRSTAEGAGISIIGRKSGRDPKLPSIVAGAHYDHIEACAGADDNASGTAAVLQLARVLGPEDWDRTLIVACWDEEESGLHGSRHWVDQAVGQGQSIGLYLNFDAIAYADDAPNSQTLPPGVDIVFAKQLAEFKAQQYRANFIAVLADSGAQQASRYYQAHAARLELPAALIEIPSAMKNDALLADLRRSDHASFWKHDIPAVFLSDTANFRTDTYHCEVRPDTVDTLDIDFAVKVTRAAIGTLAEML